MKKLLASVMALVCVFSLVACGGNVKDVKITDCLSEIYSDAEIESAIDEDEMKFLKDLIPKKIVSLND